MKKLRIIEKQYSDGTSKFEIQKKLLGFLWWVNVVDDDAWTHNFDSLDAAKKELDYYADPGSWPRKTIVFQNFEDEK